MLLLRNPRAFAEQLRGSLWFLPTVSVVAAVVLGLLLPRVRISSDGFLSHYVFTGGADGARGLLQAVTGSVITVTSLTFSLTVVTLQLASSQFSPRLLRTFLRDRGTQSVLSLFLATSAYGIVVLRTIRSSSGDVREEFVPQLAVTVGVLLALASIGGLVYFIDHITSEIRVDTMLRNVNGETRTVIDFVYPVPHDGSTDPQPQHIPHHAAALLAQRSGFLQGVDTRPLLAAAVEAGAVVQVSRTVGDQIVTGTPLAYVWSLESGGAPVDAKAMQARLNRAVTVGYERTIAQDVPFGFRQLVDVAGKALSPGVNDPTTAVHAIGHLNHLLCVLAGRLLYDDSARDAEGRVRVIVPRHSFGFFVEMSVGQLRRYGSNEPDVAVALLGLLADVGGCCRTPRQRAAVQREIGLVVAAAEREVAEAADLEAVHSTARRAEEALRAVWRTGGTPAERTEPVASTTSGPVVTDN